VTFAFAHYFRSLIERSGLTQTALAGRSGCPLGTLNNAVTGNRPPSIRYLQAWVEGLELVGEEAQRFLDLAAIAHLPEEMQPRFEQLLEDFSALRGDYDELLRTVRHLADRGR